MLKEPPTLVTLLQPHPEQLSSTRHVATPSQLWMITDMIARHTAYILVANRLRGEILFLQYTLGTRSLDP
jgi:hypothetical protein